MKKYKIIVIKSILLCMIMSLWNTTGIGTENSIGEIKEVPELPVETHAPTAQPTPVPPEPIIYFDGGMEIVPPDKTEYIEGEYLDLTGLEVYEISGIVYSDGSQEITYRNQVPYQQVDLMGKPLTCYDTKVTVTARIYVHGGGIGFEAKGEFEIKVRPDYAYEIGTISVVEDSGGAESEELVVDVEVEKKKEAEEPVCIFVAAYDAMGMLVGTDEVQAEMEIAEKMQFTFYLPANSKVVEKVKAYVWDTMEGMQPLAESKMLDLYSDSTKLKDQEKMICEH